MGRRQLPLFATLGACVLLLVSTAAQDGAAAQDTAQVREFAVVGNHYVFSPAGLSVNRNDLVKITFTAQDIPHSFTVEGYRIMKRAGAGQTVTFEFRADKPGDFVFFCSLTQDEKCKDMKGTLTVR